MGAQGVTDTHVRSRNCREIIWSSSILNLWRLPDSCSYDLAMRLGDGMFVNLFHIIQEDRRAFVASAAESIYAMLSEVRY